MSAIRIRIESGLFAQINPASAFVGECCLLSEKLDTLLRLIAENEPVSDILCEASQKISASRVNPQVGLSRPAVSEEATIPVVSTNDKQQKGYPDNART